MFAQYTHHLWRVLSRGELKALGWREAWKWKRRDVTVVRTEVGDAADSELVGRSAEGYRILGGRQSESWLVAPDLAGRVGESVDPLSGSGSTMRFHISCPISGSTMSDGHKMKMAPRTR